MSEITEIHTRERNSSEAAGIRPLFIDRPHGRLFAVHRPPRRPDAPDEAVLYVHPFAEEMNQSRRMATLQAEALAESGYGVLTLDLTGCGDSTGDFADAGWKIWQDDIAAGRRWLSDQGYRHISLWGLRLGAALALETAIGDATLCRRLVLWQPVVSGKTMLTQFL
jgi:exosortase A-associated hydrolase 2